MQKFKETDLLETRMTNVALPIFELLSLEKDAFYEDAFNAFPLGEVLFDTARAPLTNAISREIFRVTFQEIFESFIAGGTFETYLTVFRKIFGDDVEVEFTIPEPGKLIIDIEAQEVILSDFISRTIENNAFVYDEIVDEEDDNIAFQTIQGFESQYELEKMLFEMVAAGIYTEISLTIGT